MTGAVKILPAQVMAMGAVGIDLVHSDSGSLRIAKIWPGSAADSGQLVEGDTLLSVEGISVDGLPLHVIESILSGPAGSPVTVILQRNIDGGGQRAIVASLTRTIDVRYSAHAEDVRSDAHLSKNDPGHLFQGNDDIHAIKEEESFESHRLSRTECNNDDASSDSLYHLDFKMESRDFDDCAFSFDHGYEAIVSEAPANSSPRSSIRSETLSHDIDTNWGIHTAHMDICTRHYNDYEKTNAPQLLGGKASGRANQASHKLSVRHVAGQPGNSGKKAKSAQENLSDDRESNNDSEDSVQADLLAQSVILAKCEQLQAALHEALQDKQQLEATLSKLDDLNQERAVKFIELEETVEKIQESLDMSKSINAKQQAQIAMQEVRLLELTITTSLSKATENQREQTHFLARDNSDSTQVQVNRWIALYRREAERCEQLEEKLQLLARSTSRSCAGQHAGMGEFRGSDGNHGDAEDRRSRDDSGRLAGDDGAQVLHTLIDAVSCIQSSPSQGRDVPSVSEHQASARALGKLQEFVQSEDASTAVLAILALGCLGQHDGGGPLSTASPSELIAQLCPHAVTKATSLLSSGGSRSRRYAALLLCSLSQSTSGRELIEQHTACVSAIVKSLADKDAFAAAYSVQTVWHLVAKGGGKIWREGTVRPSQVAAALHAAAHRSGLNAAASQQALAALHLIQ